jgi:hypothetical protein
MNATHEKGSTATKLSRRAESLGTENAFVVLAEVNALIRQGKEVVSFAVSPTTPPNIQKAAIEAIKAGKHGHTPPPASRAGARQRRISARAAA